VNRRELFKRLLPSAAVLTAPIILPKRVVSSSTFMHYPVVCPDCGLVMDIFNEWRQGNHKRWQHPIGAHPIDARCPNAGKFFDMPKIELGEQWEGK